MAKHEINCEQLTQFSRKVNWKWAKTYLIIDLLFALSHQESMEKSNQMFDSKQDNHYQWQLKMFIVENLISTIN